MHRVPFRVPLPPTAPGVGWPLWERWLPRALRSDCHRSSAEWWLPLVACCFRSFLLQDVRISYKLWCLSLVITFPPFQEHIGEDDGMLYRHGTSREVKARPLMEIDGGRTLRARNAFQLRYSYSATVLPLMNCSAFFVTRYSFPMTIEVVRSFSSDRRTRPDTHR